MSTGVSILPPSLPPSLSPLPSFTLPFFLSTSDCKCKPADCLALATAKFLVPSAVLVPVTTRQTGDVVGSPMRWQAHCSQQTVIMTLCSTSTCMHLYYLSGVQNVNWTAKFHVLLTDRQRGAVCSAFHHTFLVAADNWRQRCTSSTCLLT